MIRRLLIALLPAFALAATPAAAGPAWTFCVASALGSKDVWITGPLFTSTDRDKLEDQFKSLLERQGHSRIVAQCPSPSEDKPAVVNAQTKAEEFNRKLGSTLHGVSAREFPPRP
jgi:hypothetical protein